MEGELHSPFLHRPIGDSLSKITDAFDHCSLAIHAKLIHQFRFGDICAVFWSDSRLDVGLVSADKDRDDFELGACPYHTQAIDRNLRSFRVQCQMDSREIPKL